MKSFWSEKIKGLEPYTPGEQPRDRKYIKLNTNENPYPPSEKVTAAIKAAACDTLRLYPDPTTLELNTAIAKYFDVDPDCVFTGNGSDEILAFCFPAFFASREPIVFPDVTYSFYPVYSELFGVKYKLASLNDDFTISADLLCMENGGVIFPNPNAPTGIAMGIDAIKKIVSSNPKSVVVVDEAYVDFGAESAVKLTKKYPNLLVVQTLSKSRSLAGLRVGFAIGNKGLIAALGAVKNSFNSYTLDRLAIAGAAAVMSDVKYYEECRGKVIKTRVRVSQELEELGFEVLPSKANFLFVRHRSKKAEELFKELREGGILVRFFKKPRIENFLRISIGTDDEMDALISALSDLL